MEDRFCWKSLHPPVEGEALAARGRCPRRYFVLGCEYLIVAVDHKPLLGIFATRALDYSNPRLCNLKTLRYNFRVIHISGARNRVSDCMSRNPTGDPNPPNVRLRLTWASPSKNLTCHTFVNTKIYIFIDISNFVVINNNP